MAKPPSAADGNSEQNADIEEAKEANGKKYKREKKPVDSQVKETAKPDKKKSNKAATNSDKIDPRD